MTLPGILKQITATDNLDELKTAVMDWDSWRQHTEILLAETQPNAFLLSCLNCIIILVYFYF